MICANCGEEIHSLIVNMFNHEGADSFINYFIEEDEETGAVWFDTTTNWTGYELSEEEMNDTIECPYCHEHPFNDKEIQVFNIVRIVKFTDDVCEKVDADEETPAI